MTEKEIPKDAWYLATDLSSLYIQEGVLSLEWLNRQLLATILRERTSNPDAMSDEETKLLTRALLKGQTLFWKAWEQFCIGRTGRRAKESFESLVEKVTAEAKIRVERTDDGISIHMSDSDALELEGLLPNYSDGTTLENATVGQKLRVSLELLRRYNR